jgi:hypothetical protein
MTSDRLSRYRAQEVFLAEAGVRVPLVGKARFARACPECRTQICVGEHMVNLGFDGSWLWVHLACAPADPGDLEMVRRLKMKRMK